MSNNISRVHTNSASTTPPPAGGAGLQKGFQAFVSALFGNGNAKALLGVAGMDMSKLGERLSGAWTSLAQATSHQAQKDTISKIQR